jgi:Tfp pilus assembly pilus retraction ATPase PilT
VIGEIRDAETMRAALRAAESGHLVLASTHAPTALAAVRKVLAYLDSANDAIAFSNSLIGVVAQALVLGSNGRTMNLACEVLNGQDAKVQEAIAAQDPVRLAHLERALRSGQLSGDSLAMQKSLKSLVQAGRIDARRAAAVLQSAQERAELLELAKAGAPLAASQRGAAAGPGAAGPSIPRGSIATSRRGGQA